MKTVLLFFGSFSPIHVGHVALAEYALAHTGADELWLVLSPQNPHKQSSTLWDDALRLRLAKAAVRDTAIKVSDIEFSLPRPNYTYHTLEVLRSRYPDTDFQLLIGADNYALFDRWRNYDEILRHHSIWAYPREGTTPDLARFPQIKWLNAPLFPISSTMIRKKIETKESITGLVPPEVEKAIKALNL